MRQRLLLKCQAGLWVFISQLNFIYGSSLHKKMDLYRNEFFQIKVLKIDFQVLIPTTPPPKQISFSHQSSNLYVRSKT